MKLETIYRATLRLYPAGFRYEYADEMDSVYRLADMAARSRGRLLHLQFAMRELSGLVSGAAREHFRQLGGAVGHPSSTRSFMMKNGFRYPKMTVVLMFLIFATVVSAIEKAIIVQNTLPALHPPYPVTHAAGLLQPFVIMFLIACAVAVAGWFIVHALHRSGEERLSELQTWPPR